MNSQAPQTAPRRRVQGAARWLCCVCVLGVLAPGCRSRDVPPDQSSSAAAPAELGDEWQTQLAAVQSGESEAIRIVQQVIGPRELSDLQSVPNLTELLLDAGAVDDAGLVVIAGLKQLEHLRIRGGAITDVGLAHLATGNLESLRIINLPQASVTAVGIGHLAALPALVQVRLGGAGIDDQAVAELAKLPQLRSLHLIAPKLTERALDELAHAPKLASFYLDDCLLGDAAWEKLFAAKPGLHVHMDQAHHDRDPNRHLHP